MHNKSIIQIGGFKRSGKDTLASMIANHYISTGKTVDIFHYADSLKQIAASIFNISLEQLDDFKNNKTKLWRFDEFENAYLVTDFREILMKIGNEAIKPIFGDDVWRNIMSKKIEKSNADIIIIPDFRFNVEHLSNAVTIRILNNDIINDTNHPSETELIDFDFDMSIDNTGYNQTQESISYYCEQMVDNYLKQKEYACKK